jgi:hypothetical protein
VRTRLSQVGSVCRSAATSMWPVRRAGWRWRHHGRQLLHRGGRSGRPSDFVGA